MILHHNEFSFVWGHPAAGTRSPAREASPVLRLVWRSVTSSKCWWKFKFGNAKTKKEMVVKKVTNEFDDLVNMQDSIETLTGCSCELVIWPTCTESLPGWSHTIIYGGVCRLRRSCIDTFVTLTTISFFRPYHFEWWDSPSFRQHCPTSHILFGTPFVPHYFSLWNNLIILNLVDQCYSPIIQ